MGLKGRQIKQIALQGFLLILQGLFGFLSWAHSSPLLEQLSQSLDQGLGFESLVREEAYRVGRRVHTLCERSPSLLTSKGRLACQWMGVTDELLESRAFLLNGANVQAGWRAHLYKRLIQGSDPVASLLGVASTDEVDGVNYLKRQGDLSATSYFLVNELMGREWPMVESFYAPLQIVQLKEEAANVLIIQAWLQSVDDVTFLWRLGQLVKMVKTTDSAGIQAIRLFASQRLSYLAHILVSKEYYLHQLAYPARDMKGPLHSEKISWLFPFYASVGGPSRGFPYFHPFYMLHLDGTPACSRTMTSGAPTPLEVQTIFYWVKAEIDEGEFDSKEPVSATRLAAEENGDFGYCRSLTSWLQTVSRINSSPLILAQILARCQSLIEYRQKSDWASLFLNGEERWIRSFEDLSLGGGPNLESGYSDLSLYHFFIKVALRLEKEKTTNDRTERTQIDRDLFVDSVRRWYLAESNSSQACVRPNQVTLNDLTHFFKNQSQINRDGGDSIAMTQKIERLMGIGGLSNE